MLIGLRNVKSGELVFKDILDLDFDMSVKMDENSGKYQILINKNFAFKDDFSKKVDAEEEMECIADSRNSLEQAISNI